jgi:hypothetical protein
MPVPETTFNFRMPIRDARLLTGTETLIHFNQVNLKRFVCTAITKTPTQLTLTAGGKVYNYDLTREQTTNIPISVVQP